MLGTLYYPLTTSCFLRFSCLAAALTVEVPVQSTFPFLGPFAPLSLIIPTIIIHIKKEGLYRVIKYHTVADMLLIAS